MLEYTLEVTENQLKTLSLALDIFSRLESGQFERCFSVIPWKQKDKMAEANELLNRLQLLLTGMNRGNLGIGQVSEKAKVAYDLHQVVRHYIAWANEPRGGETVDFWNPLQMSHEPLAKIKLTSSNVK